MTIRPARELAHALLRMSHLPCFFTVGGTVDGWTTAPHAHEKECDRLTAAIEADRREVVEACAVALGPCGHLECDRLGDYDGCQRLRAIAIAKEKTT